MADILGTLGAKALEVALPILATTIATMVVAILKRVLAKQKIDMDIAQEERLKEVVEGAVLSVEELTRRTRQKSITMPPSSEEKMKIAVTRVRERLPKATEADIREAVDAALPIIRAKLGADLVMPVE